MPGLQSLPDLSNADFLPGYLNRAVVDQINQAQQFNNVGLQQNQADLEAKGLQNLFDRQNNPLKLDQQRLTNEGMGITNRTNAVTANIAESTQEEAKAAKRAELLKSASMADLQNLQAQAQQDLMSNDPNVVARGRKKMDASWEEITRRNKHSDEMEKTNAEIQGRKDVANIGAGATVEAARIGAGARVDAAKARNSAIQDFDQAVATGKITPQKAAVYWANKAQQATDPAEQAEALAAAARYERLSQTTTPAVAGQGGKIDPSSLLPDVKLKENPSAFGGAPPALRQPTSNNMWVGNPAQVASYIGSIADPQARAAALQQYMQSQGMANRQPSAAPPKTYNSLPQGARQIGTSKGKPVYELPDGTRIIGE